MFMTILTLVIGILLGYTVSSIVHTNDSIGVLHVVESDGLEEPYLFLELDESTENIIDNTYVTMKVRTKK